MAATWAGERSLQKGLGRGQGGWCAGSQREEVERGGRDRMLDKCPLLPAVRRLSSSLPELFLEMVVMVMEVYIQDGILPVGSLLSS